MIREEQIPDEVVTVLTMLLLGHSLNDKNVSLALAAALNAWPGAAYVNWRNYGEADRIVLPLLHKKDAT